MHFGQTSKPYHSPQSQGVVRGMRFGVVVKVDVQIPPGPQLQFHPFAPCSHHRLGIAAPILILRAVQADICERPDGQAREKPPESKLKQVHPQR
jgi:hypothetical protein